MKRILIVDDHPHVIRVVRLALERNGYRVDTAANGEIALEMLGASPYDAMITDVEMPRMDGQALCETMHRRYPDRSPFTLVVTGKASPALKTWAAALPNTEYLEKPLSLQRLGERLQQVFATGSGAESA